MTTIQNIQAPSIRINADVIRKAAFVGKALAVTAGLVALTVAVVAFASVVSVSAATYSFVLVSTIVAMSALAIRENANEAKKTQYDIR